MRCRNLRMLEATSHCKPLHKPMSSFFDEQLRIYQEYPTKEQNGYNLPTDMNGDTLLYANQVETIRNHLREAQYEENQASSCLPNEGSKRKRKTKRKRCVYKKSLRKRN